jgi:hypothetical protein
MESTKKSTKKANIKTLTAAGVIPDGYKFTPGEKRAIESLSAQEVAAIVSARKKLGPNFIQAHAPHGFMY